jgi:hypothetical protein
MTQLYIANATAQVIQFAYWPPERTRLITQTIPIGGQVRIAAQGSRTDLSNPEIDFIVGQHRKYGLIPIGEVDSSTLPFHGICYSVGEPISPERLHLAMQRNQQALEQQGKIIRLEAALAVNDLIEKQTGENLNKLEMSVKEMEPRSGYSEDHKPLGEGVRVTREQDRGHVRISQERTY